MVTIRKATKEQIVKALDETNKIFDGNITFKKIVPKANNYTVTLTVNSSKGKGGRLGFTFEDGQKPRHISAACWHVYGSFFDHIFDLSPGAIIISNGEKITADNGQNWNDRNIGSQVRPLLYSEACECEKLIGDIPQKYC
jgi:hypothetical protein